MSKREMEPRQKAWSQFEVKSVDESLRVLQGLATTPTPDRMGDIVEPLGASFELPIPFLWQHDAEQPIGHVTAAKATKSGIEVNVKLAKIDEPGRLKDRLDEAWQSIKAKLVRGMSIGFSPLEYSYMEETGGYRFMKWAWLELSAVTIPANADASIALIKNYGTKASDLVIPKKRPIITLPPRKAKTASRVVERRDFASRYFKALEEVQDESVPRTGAAVSGSKGAT